MLCICAAIWMDSIRNEVILEHICCLVIIKQCACAILVSFGVFLSEAYKKSFHVVNLTSGTQVLVDSFQRCCKIRSTTPQIISSDWETCVGIIVRRAVHSFAMFPWNSTHTVLLKAIVLSRMASATGDNFRNLTNFYCFVGMATILFTVYRVPIHNSQMTLGIDSITFAQVSKFFTWNRKWDLLLSSLIDSSVHHWPIHCSVIYLKIIFY